MAFGSFGAAELILIVLLGIFSGPATFFKVILFAVFGLTLR